MGTYLGGTGPSDQLPEVPGRRPGTFVVDLDRAMIGIVTMEDAELGYLFLPSAWGHGVWTP